MTVGAIVSRVVSGIGAVVLVALLLAVMLMMGFALGASGFGWVGAIAVVGILGVVLYRMLK